jgi:hypothetical protein
LLKEKLNEELILWSVFTHPLKELSDHQVKDTRLRLFVEK